MSCVPNASFFPFWLCLESNFFDPYSAKLDHFNSYGKYASTFSLNKRINLFDHFSLGTVWSTTFSNFSRQSHTCWLSRIWDSCFRARIPAWTISELERLVLYSMIPNAITPDDSNPSELLFSLILCYDLLQSRREVICEVLQTGKKDMHPNLGGDLNLGPHAQNFFCLTLVKFWA